MSDAPVSTPRSMVARQLGKNDVGAQGFLKWLKVAMPDLYDTILPDVKKLQMSAASAAQSLSGLGTFGDSGTATDGSVPAGNANASSTWVDSLKSLISAYGQYKLTDTQLKTVQKITDANLARAQAGLAPLPYDASELGLAPTLNVGLSGSASKLLTYGALGVGAYLLLNLFMGRRRHA